MKLSTLILLFTVILFSCTQSHSKNEVESAMHRYDSLIVTMNADAISKMFTPDGKLGDMAQGRDSIKKFLLSFTDVDVLSMSSDTKSIDMKGDSSVQTGGYEQIAVKGKDTVNVKGTYTARWKYIKGEGWKLQELTTQPE